jgi:hypothetical protein
MHNVAADIHVRSQTLLTAGETCEQLMHVISPILTTFLAVT